jgi:nitrous oxidase accessory protein NosD
MRLISFVFVCAITFPVEAAVLHVPRQYATIQNAIDAAAAGDTIVVRHGRYCGATVTKPVSLIGRGRPTIVGCATGPTLVGPLRVGLFLDGKSGASPASGTSVRGFAFDGAGISDTNLAPLAFGVFARFASDVVVEDNHFDGTVQAITNSGGDRWLVIANRIRNLTLFQCAAGDICGGGDGIVMQLARDASALPGGATDDNNRPADNRVLFNEVEGALPDNFDAFSMVGILLLAADDTVVFGNRLVIPANPTGQAKGEGIVVTNSCCGEEQHFTPGTRGAIVIANDGERSQYVVAVEGGPGENTTGLVLFGNEGKVLREDLGQTAMRLPIARTLLSPVHAPF